MARRRIRQTGKTTKSIDRRYKAKKPGYRKSRKGKKYYENRKNRSDVNPKVGL
jgi:hypothetical protein